MSKFRCSRCKKDRPANDFSPTQRRRFSGGWCKPCFREYNRLRRGIPDTRNCAACDTVISQPHGRQIYCSDACKQRGRYWATNPRLTRRCPECKTDISHRRRDIVTCGPRCNSRARARLGKDVAVRRARSLKTKYNLTPEEFEDMRTAQDGRCAICGNDGHQGLCTRGHPGGCECARLNVDHCHATGKVRGLLCHLCNRALGQFKDSPANLRRAAEYVELHQAEAA